MELDLETKQLLADLIAKPELVTQAHAGTLANLVNAYPYYQPLHLLLAKASLNNEDHTNTLATAALYTNGTLLHQVIYQPETLTTVIIDQPTTAPEVESILQAPTSSPTDEQEVFEEIAEVVHSPVEETTVKTEGPNPDEQETYDEIVEVDATAFPTTLPEDEIQEVEPPVTETVPDELAIESIVATDFFAFEKSFSTEQAIENTKEEVLTVVQPEEYNLEAEAQTVSKYDDDKLPYTFLWWLAKTRKEHAQIFQPYVTQKKTDDQNPSELQQQYVEHIFHIQTPFNVADEASKGPINRQIVPKGIDIIDSFIKNDPQIKVPKADQINNENKAKKSAEDNYDLVSETLAAIYIEQMLYHKAIDTYEKLSLKFPEKSRYFADLIQSLEKKI
jgi:hypothetical protein